MACGPRDPAPLSGRARTSPGGRRSSPPTLKIQPAYDGKNRSSSLFYRPNPPGGRGLKRGRKRLRSSVDDILEGLEPTQLDHLHQHVGGVQDGDAGKASE